jgi:hypothetical protein
VKCVVMPNFLKIISSSSSSSDERAFLLYHNTLPVPSHIFNMVGLLSTFASFYSTVRYK